MQSGPNDMMEKRRAWEENVRTGATARGVKFTTVSGEQIRMLYGPEDVEEINFLSEIGYPGDFPYTRGIHPMGYRGKLWTMRQFAGFGTPEDTNERYHYLLEHGQTGLSVAFDLPTLMGCDADDARSEGEVGICGVSVSSLADMEVLFKGIDLAEISTSMTINAPAAMMMAFYLAVAEKQGREFSALRGTTQTDILKEYIAQKEWIYANEGWKVKEQALEKIKWLEQEGVEFVEQPMPASDLAGTAWTRERANLPLIADENSIRLHDVPKLQGVFDGINIKLMKCTGLREAYRMVATARACGLKTMLGCMIETSVAISAAAHLSPIVDYADLDGNVLITDDPFDGVRSPDGKLVLSDRPGIGVERRI